MRDEIAKACDATIRYYMRVRCGSLKPEMVLHEFYDKWQGELSSRISACMKYNVWAKVCIGDMINSPETLCEVKFVGMTKTAIQFEFSHHLDSHWIPSSIKADKDGRPYIDNHGGYLNGSIVNPGASDELWNDSHLGLSLISAAFAADRSCTTYPMGTMYILLPPAETLKGVQLEYEKAWLYMSMVQSEVVMSDEIIEKMMNFMSRVKI